MTGRLVVGITGASGSIYGIRLLEVLRGSADVQTHLVISVAGKRTLVVQNDDNLVGSGSLDSALR